MLYKLSPYSLQQPDLHPLLKSLQQALDTHADLLEKIHIYLDLFTFTGMALLLAPSGVSEVDPHNFSHYF